MTLSTQAIQTLLRDTTLFSSLDDNALWSLAAATYQLTLDEGDLLFKKGDQTNGFYIILDGKLAILEETSTSFTEKSILLNKDFAGEEAIFYQQERKTSILAKQTTHLIFFDNLQITELLEAYPEVRTNVGLLVESRKLHQRVKMDWIGKDESVMVMTRKHPILLLGSALLPVAFFSAIFLLVSLLSRILTLTSTVVLVLLGVGFLFSLLWETWNILNWANDYYIITNKRMVWVEKVAGFYDSRQEAPLNTLLSVGTSKTRLGNLLGYADVIVRTYVGNIHFQKVAHAPEIGRMIEAYWSRIKIVDLEDEGEAMRSALKKKLTMHEDEKLQTLEVEEKVVEQIIPEARGASFFDWLFSDFLRVRFEVGGTTTYRKHWFMLVKGIWIPLILFLLGMILLGAFSTYNLTFISRSAGMLLSGLSIIGISLWMLYQYVDWRNDMFQLTDDQVIDIDRKPLGKESRRTAPLENILSIEYERLGIWGVLFNFGTVYITVGNTKLTFDHVYNPSEVQQDIFTRMGTRLEEKRQINIANERERVSEWFKIYHEQSQGSNQDLSGRSQPDDATQTIDRDV